MNHRKVSSLIIALTALGFATASVAADPSAVLQQVNGRVLVGQNDTTVPGQEGMKLFAGTRVVAVSGAWAKLVYTDGCTVNLPQNSMMTVAGPGQCSAGKALAAKTEGLNGQPVGQTGRRGGAFWTPAHVLGIPGLLVVGGGIGAWLNDSNNNSDNNSQQTQIALANARQEQERQAALYNAQIAALLAEEAALRARILADEGTPLSR